MRLGVMQPYFFPYLGYFQLINLVDHFVLYDDVTYIKGGFINRNRIINKFAVTSWTMCLNHSSSNKLINEITYIKKTWIKLLKTLQQNYAKAPNFDIIYPMICDIAKSEVETISELNYVAIKTICDFLEIDTPIYLCSELAIPKLGRTERLIAICKGLNCDTYINAEGGKKLYSKEEFKRHNVNLYFIRMTPTPYKQYSDMPHDYLSIIDVLMFNSKEKVQEYLECNYVLS